MRRSILKSNCHYRSEYSHRVVVVVTICNAYMVMRPALFLATGNLKFFEIKALKSIPIGPCAMLVAATQAVINLYHATSSSAFNNA